MILYVLKIFCCKVLRTDTFEYYALYRLTRQEELCLLPNRNLETGDNFRLLFYCLPVTGVLVLRQRTWTYQVRAEWLQLEIVVCRW